MQEGDKVSVTTPTVAVSIDLCEERETHLASAGRLVTLPDPTLESSDSSLALKIKSKLHARIIRHIIHKWGNLNGRYNSPLSYRTLKKDSRVNGLLLVLTVKMMGYK